jgi:nucleoside-diphosphate-sugar epimerase
LLEQGFKVRALVRTPTKAAGLSTRGVELVQGDLHNPTALEQLVAGSDAVIHSAGAVRGSSQQAFDQVNVAGTAALLDAINTLDNNPRLLLLSSLAAREPHLSWYAQSKRGGEELLQKATDLDWVIVRPPAVYGPGDKEMLPVFQMMARGLATVPGSLESRTSLIHVSDLVNAIIACLLSENTRHQTLSLCDDQEGGYSWQDMAAVAGTTWNRRVRLWRVPSWLLDTVAALNIRLARLTGSAPMLTPAKLRELRHPDWVVDNRAITAATGWTPQIGLREGLEALKSSAL